MQGIWLKVTQSPNHPDHDSEDLVTIHVQVYHIKCEDREADSYLVGDHGLKYPKHEEYMHWLPKGLVHSVSVPDSNGLQAMRIPRWLAVKKDLNHD